MLINDFFKTIINVAEQISIPNVVIGGLALPAYNITRTTLDIDLCIHVSSQE